MTAVFDGAKSPLLSTSDCLLGLRTRNQGDFWAVQELISDISPDRWARMLSNPPSPQAIAQAKATWGITDD